MNTELYSKVLHDVIDPNTSRLICSHYGLKYPLYNNSYRSIWNIKPAMLWKVSENGTKYKLIKNAGEPINWSIKTNSSIPLSYIERFLPAWNVDELMLALPLKILINEHTYNFSINIDKYGYIASYKWESADNTTYRVYMSECDKNASVCLGKTICKLLTHLSINPKIELSWK